MATRYDRPVPGLFPLPADLQPDARAKRLDVGRDLLQSFRSAAHR